MATFLIALKISAVCQGEKFMNQNLTQTSMFRRRMGRLIRATDHLITTHRYSCLSTLQLPTILYLSSRAEVTQSTTMTPTFQISP